MYIKRAVEDTIKKVSSTFPVLLVTGARQVGKTTLLKRTSEPERKYVTLDDPFARELAQRDPALFLQRYTPPVLIDEIQYAPQLLPYVKMEVDKSGKNGQFWLTGSQMFHLMKNVSESLAGRVGIVQLHGLSSSEINGNASEPFTTDTERLVNRASSVKPKSLLEVFERIQKGSMPKLYENPDVDTETFYSSYVNTYLQRDIKDLTQVADEMSFFNFLTVVAARTAKPVVFEELAKEAGISAPTAKQWLSILVSSGIVVLVQPYHNNVLKRVVKQPLLHFLDTGLCAYLLKWSTPEILEKGAMSGAFFESWVFSEIYKSYTNAGKNPPLYYYRDKDKKEVDIILYENGTLCPVEVKKSASPPKSAVGNFDVLKAVETPEKFGELEQFKVEVGKGAVVCMTNDLLPLDEKNWYVPAWLV